MPATKPKKDLGMTPAALASRRGVEQHAGYKTKKSKMPA
jgi:hypothetical protein